MIELDGAISPENTIFVLLCFEGPDVYSTAGGLGTRVSELSEALATQGYTTHLIFIGDPTKPSVEQRVEGRLVRLQHGVAGTVLPAPAVGADAEGRHFQSRSAERPGRKARLPGRMVNQTDQVQLVGHGGELPANGLQSEKETAVVHDRNFAIETNRRTMNFQRAAECVLTGCLSGGGRFTQLRSTFQPAGKQ